MIENLLRDKIVEQLKQGKSKLEIYNELEAYSQNKNLRRILASIPTKLERKNNRILHKLISFLWIILFITELMTLFDFYIQFDIKALISFAITTYLMTQIFRFNGDILLPSTIWLGWAILNFIMELLELPKSDPDFEIVLIVGWVYMVIFAIAITLTLILRNRVFGYYKWFRPKTTSNGQPMFQKEEYT